MTASYPSSVGVFLTDTQAYKLKKPVRTHHLDYSTVELRRLRCDEEVRLNRRLTRDVYLGVSPLLREGGALKLSPTLLQPGCELSGEGEVADWLVVMRRLPRERTLERLVLASDALERTRFMLTILEVPLFMPAKRNI